MNLNIDSQVHVDVLRRYAKPIAHMRQLCDSRRLGLVLGAGVSLDAALPGWKQLVAGVREALAAQGIVAIGSEKESLPTQIQVLFARFRDSVFAAQELQTLEQAYKEAEVAARWRRVVHGILYRGVKDVETAIKNHPYLEVLAALAYRLPLVVSYNFDDLLERALAIHAKRLQDSHTVGYYPAWGPNFLLQDGRPVVYHPNGFLPFDLVDRYSENIILTEEALSDQIVGFGLGEYATLLDYFSRTPCLLIGFSLEDTALRTLLRQSVRRSPGSIHYYVRFIEDNSLTDDQMRDIRETNFDLFNVVTLFLTTEDLRALLELVAVAPETQLYDTFGIADQPPRYLYYVAGPVSVGKTSVIARLRGVDVVDEWLTPRKPEIAKPSTELHQTERQAVDEWIMDQVRLKNFRFRQASLGIHIMDRAPLDAFAFTPEELQKEKAALIWKRARVARMPLEAGTVLLLKGRPEDLEMRQRWRGRNGDAAYCSKQQQELIKTYCDSALGAYEIDTTGQSIEVVVRRMLKIMHLSPYREFDFNARLNSYLQRSK